MPLLSPEFLRRLEALELATRQARAGALPGERLSIRKGRGIEFADHRPYAPGDDFRFLDWSLVGRLDRLFIRLFHEEREQQLQIYLDGSPSMQFGAPTKFLVACQVAAALGYVALRQQCRLTVHQLGRPPRTTNTFRGRGAIPRFLDQCNAWSPHEVPNGIGGAMQQMAVQILAPGTTVIVSDFWDQAGVIAGLRSVAARGQELLALRILTPDETEPTQLGPVQFLDSESGDSLEVVLDATLLQTYREQFQADQAELQRVCRSSGGRFQLCRTDDSLERIIGSIFHPGRTQARLPK